MVNRLHHGKHWLTSAGSGSRCHYLKEGKFGTFMLMSPMLMFLGISGRFMFFTADTARAGAPAIPACTHIHTQNTHGGDDKIQISKSKIMLYTTNTHTHTHTHTHWTVNIGHTYTRTVLNRDKQLLTKCKSTDSYSDRQHVQNVHSDAFIASYAHALFGSIMIYTTTRANYESTVRTHCTRPFTNLDILSSTGHSSNGQKAALLGKWTHRTLEDR